MRALMANWHPLNHPSVSVPGSCSPIVSVLRDCFCSLCDALMSLHSHLVPDYGPLPFHGVGVCPWCSLSCFLQFHLLGRVRSSAVAGCGTVFFACGSASILGASLPLRATFVEHVTGFLLQGT